MKALAKSPSKSAPPPAPKPKLVPVPAQSERFKCQCAHCESWRESQRVLFAALQDAVGFLEVTSKISCIRWTDADHARIRELAEMVGK